jgi:hypothetical protein
MSFRFQFPQIFTLSLSLLCTLHAQDNPRSLVGVIQGDKYVSPTGAFSVTIPVLPELGGSISDTDNVVSFQDAYTTHQSIACFKMDATQHREEETRGRKEYLIWFFTNFVQADFQQRYPGASIESAHFLHNVQSGTLLTYNLLPGGSMFALKAEGFGKDHSPLAKRGNLVFIQNDFVYVISIELVEKALERSSFTKTVAEEDAILRTRLLKFLDKITFPVSTPAAAQPAGTPSK